MKLPTWTKPAVAGAVLGALATMAIGFGQGGWYSTGAAERLADDRSAGAVIEALVPICVAQSKLDPDIATKIKHMTGMITGYEQRDFVMKAGWATTSNADGPNRDVAAGCADVLIKPRQG